MRTLVADRSAPSYRTMDPNPLTTTADVPYVSPADTFGSVESRRLLDVLEPTGATNLPVLVMVHGGGWSGGNKSDLTVFAQWWARLGYVVMNANYRLAPTWLGQEMVDDMRTLIEWVRANATTYHGNPDHVGAIGFSAGAHLLAMNVCQNARTRSAPDALVSWSGPLDLQVGAGAASIETNAASFLGYGTYAEIPAATLATFSPAQHVPAGSVPWLLCQCENDVSFPYVRSGCAETVAALSAAGVAHRARRYSGLQHASTLWPRAAGDTLAFLETFVAGRADRPLPSGARTVVVDRVTG